MTTECAKVGIPPLARGQPSVLSCTGTESGDKSVEEGCSALPHRIGAVCPPSSALLVAHHWAANKTRGQVDVKHAGVERALREHLSCLTVRSQLWGCDFRENETLFSAKLENEDFLLLKFINQHRL